MEENKLIVRKIRNGTIIDHIPAGQALNVLKLMGITGREGFRIALAMNVESRKLGRKDLVKIENLELDPEHISKIALIAPTATINIVRDFKVVEKRKVDLPEIIEEIISCINPNCITNQPREPVKPRFRKLSTKPLKLVCDYCGYVMGYEKIVNQLIGGY